MPSPEVGGYGLTITSDFTAFVDDVDITEQCLYPSAYPLTKTQTIDIHGPNGNLLHSGSTIKINNIEYTIEESVLSSFDFTDTSIKVELVSEPSGFVPLMYIKIHYTSSTDEGGGDTMTFKHFYKGAKIGTGTIAFRDFAPVPTLATPTNVEVADTTLSWDAVENAESYDVYADDTVLLGNTDGGGVTPSGETWLLNADLTFGDKSWAHDINFTSNGNLYNKFSYNFTSPMAAYLIYGTTNVYEANSHAWTNEAYRTVIFATAPTGDLLTWLQNNGTKQ